MADEKVIGGGVGGINTGDTGINDGGEAGAGGGGSNRGGGGGSNRGDSTGTSNPILTSSGASGSDDFSKKEVEINKILADWMALSAIGLTFEQVVDLYLENKLGFGKNGEALKKKYKEDNPDMDPDEIDKEVDQQLAESKKEFTEPGKTGKEELQAKYNEFKSSSFEALGNLKNIGSELAKTIANAYMPTSIGPVAPNPLSVALKLYVGLTALKKLIDRVVISMTVLMAAARSIGADKSDPYIRFINAIHGLLGPMMKSIKDKEEEGDNLKNVAKAEFLLAVKDEYTTISLITERPVNARELEEMARNEFNIYIWPLSNSDLQKLYNVLGSNPYVSMIPGIGVLVAVVDLVTTTNKERRAEMLMKYNNHLVLAAQQFEQDWQLELEAQNNIVSSSTNTGGGSSNTSKSNTYGIDGLNKTATK